MPSLSGRFMLTGSAARRLSLSVIGCLLVIDLVWLPFSALSLSAASYGALAIIIGSFFLAGPIRRGFSVPAAAQNMVVEFYILVLFGVVGFIFSYLTIESGWTIRDEWFVAIDRGLGFDWPGYVTYVLNNDLLRAASLIVYVLSPLLVGLALLRFCLDGRFERASETVTMVIFGGVLCVVISGVAPSIGGAGYFGENGDVYGDFKVVFDNSYKVDFLRLREQSGMEVSLLLPLALIAFPSYHACLSLLVVLAFRDAGLLGMVVLVINLGSLMSLPVQGGHYLSDALGGLLVGAVAYWAVCRFSPGRNRPSNRNPGATKCR